MAQVSYGTITITDTTDKNIFIRYSANVDGSNSTSSPVSNTKYIGIYCGTAQTETEAMASSSGWTWSEYIGTDGVSVTGITEIYQLRNDSATPTKRSDGTALPTAVDTVNTWSLKVPSYVSGGTYWTSTAVSMSEAPSPRYTTPVKNEALTDSNYNSAMANSIAQSANENANGAMSQVVEVEQHLSVTDTNVSALQTRLKKIWINEVTSGDYVAGTYAASGIEGITFVENNPSTFGYNTLLRHNQLALRYNTINMTQLSTAALTFYRPTTINNQLVQGDRGLVINANGIDILSISNYKLSSDTVIDPTKIYYTLNNNIYDRVATPSGNPQSNSYYEHDIDAQLNANGLILKKGGIKAGAYSSAIDEEQNFVYLSSENYGVGTKIGDSASDKADWRQIIGNKFGVDKAGNLYAAGAHIDGDIIAQSLTIGSGANAYSGIAAINISGYSIEIEVADIVGSTETKKLIPHLYHNGMNADSEVTDVTKFLWYIDNNMSVPGAAGLSPDGYIIGEYGHTYKVIYDFGDGVVGSGSAIQTRTVDPQKYITRIDANGITIHPETQNGNSSIRLDGNGIELFNSSNESIARYGNTAKIGFDASSRFLMNASSLQAYNNNNQLYFEVNANGLSWGSNTAATTTQVNAAAQTASKYITAVDQNGIKVHAENGTNVNYSLINGEGLEVFQGTSASDTKSVAKFGSTARVGGEDDASITITDSSIVGTGDGGKEFFNFSNSANTLIIRGNKIAWPSTRGDRFPTTLEESISVTLPYEPSSTKKTVTLYIDVRVAGGTSRVTKTLAFTAGTPTTKSEYFVFDNVSCTIAAKYDGAKDISEIYIRNGSLTDNYVIHGYVDYYIESLAPCYEIGSSAEASGAFAFAEGCGTSARGNYSHACGYNTDADGDYSHAEGYYTHAEGKAAHVEGYINRASGDYSHAEGYNTDAKGNYSHSCGYNTDANGAYSLAEGFFSTAIGKGSHAQNEYTVATEDYQTVIGRYNKATVTGDGTSANPYTYSDVGNYAFIVGNGTDNTTADRSNALTVDWQGNVEAAGAINGLVEHYGAITGASLPDVNLASSSSGWNAITSFTLPDGAWLLYLTCIFATNATGFRIATIAEASAVAGTVIRTVRTPATPSAVTTIAINCPLVGGKTYYLNGLQNSGSTLKVETRYTAIKIGTGFSS